MEKAIETITFQDGATLGIFYDQDPEDPRSWNDITKFFAMHRRNNWGDKHSYKESDFDGWTEFKATLEEDFNIAFISPVYAHEHSGVAFSTGDFGDKWDSGCIGFIFITKEEAAKYHGEHGQEKREMTQEEAEAIFTGELEIYGEWCNGAVYGYVFTPPPLATPHCETCSCKAEGEEEDSCWGFYGLDPKTNGMADNLPTKYRDELKTQRS